MPYLINTDIIIRLIQEDSTVKENLAKAGNSPKAVSVITYGELLYDAIKSKNKDRNLAVLDRIMGLFPVIAIGKEVMERFSSLKAETQKTGIMIADMDMFIASTALVMDYTLVTNNLKHFYRIKELRIENWAKE